MKKNIIRLFITFLLAALPFISHAQIAAAPAAWTRGLAKAQWQTAIATTRFVPSVITNSAHFIKPLAQGNGVALFNINKDHNSLIWAQVKNSQLFSKTEKDFLVPFAPETVSLAKLTWVHDKHAAFYNHLKKQDGITINEDAFANHQTQLSRLIATLEKDLKGKVQADLEYVSPQHQDIISMLELLRVDCGFNRATIAKLFQGDGQPFFAALYEREMEIFAQQPDLGSQRNWIASMIETTQIELERLLQLPTSAMTPFLSAKYYVYKMRLEYFTVLRDVLANATEKRASIIYRYRRKLPSVPVSMTDAQRLGYLYYQRDLLPADKLQQRLTWETQINEQEALHQEFAAAEATNQSYELALRKGATSPLLLPDAEQEYIYSLKTEQQFDAKIASLEREMAAMRAQKPGNDLSFYSRYYSLVVRKDIYEGQKIMRRIFNKTK